MKRYAMNNGMHTMANTRTSTDYQIKILTASALLMAMNVIMSSFGVPVPGGHLYLNDCIITVAAILLAPGYAAAVGGIGAFLGDFFFYPTPMFFSLIAHGLQGFLISWAVRKFVDKDGKRTVKGAVIGCLIGLVVTTVVYSLGRAFVYSTPEYAILKLPYQILQPTVGAVVGILLCFKFGLMERFDKMFQ